MALTPGLRPGPLMARSRLPWLVAVCLIAFGSGPASAEVARLRIERREVVPNGKSWGAAGPYEKLVGTVEFVLDPRLPQNRDIVDLDRAPKTADGRVEFSADFYLLKPVDPARGYGRLFVEAGNRGTKRILQTFQNAANSNDPATAAEFGNGALMNQGFTLLWMGWQWDVPQGRMRMQIPIATDNGRPIVGWVRGNFIPGHNATTVSVADRGHIPYPVVDPESAEHRTVVRTVPTDRPAEIPRHRWRFTGPGTVSLDGGFEAGLIYDVVYRARDPRVVGVGLTHTDVTGTRDVEPQPTSRLYFIASAPHIVGPFPPAPFTDPDFIGQADMNPLVYTPVVRALDDWVSEGKEPPPSRLPRLADGTLTTVDRTGWPRIPQFQLPANPMTTYRLDFGPDWAKGIVTIEPPAIGKPFIGRVPAVDEAGNDRAGIRLPEIAVPLATHTGWNYRHPSIGSPLRLASEIGSYLPLPRTKADRERSGDGRQSIAERYGNRAEYLGAIALAALALVDERLLLPDDVKDAIRRAAAHYEWATTRK